MPCGHRDPLGISLLPLLSAGWLVSSGAIWLSWRFILIFTCLLSRWLIWTCPLSGWLAVIGACPLSRSRTIILLGASLLSWRMFSIGCGPLSWRCALIGAGLLSWWLVLTGVCLLSWLLIWMGARPLFRWLVLIGASLLIWWLLQTGILSGCMVWVWRENQSLSNAAVSCSTTVEFLSSMSSGLLITRPAPALKVNSFPTQSRLPVRKQTRTQTKKSETQSIECRNADSRLEIPGEILLKKKWDNQWEQKFDWPKV